MGRLTADNELVAIHAAGISLRRILVIFIILSTIFALMLFLINDRLVPSLHYRYRVDSKTLLHKNIDLLIEPGVFLEHFPNYILYVSDKDGNKLKNVFIYEVDPTQKSTKVTFAKNGEFISENNVLKMKLEDGFRDETNPENKKELYRLNFKIFFIDIPIPEKDKGEITKKPVNMSVKEIRNKVNHLKNIGVEPLDFIKEFHKRISFAFSIVTFTILGFGISLMVRHREKSINLGVAFAAGLAGYLLFILAEALIEYHVLPAFLGMWLPNVIIASLGIFLLYKNAHFR